MLRREGDPGRREARRAADAPGGPRRAPTGAAARAAPCGVAGVEPFGDLVGRDFRPGRPGPRLVRRTSSRSGPARAGCIWPRCRISSPPDRRLGDGAPHAPGARRGRRWRWPSRRAGPRKGTIHHSDHGGQFISLTFGQACHDAGIAQSMGAVGSCFDNAVAETFFATLTKERLLHRRPEAAGRPGPSCARRSSSTSRASTTRPGCTRRSGCAPRPSSKPTTPPATPTASRAPARARARAKNLCTTFGCAQLRRQHQPDSTKPGEVQSQREGTAAQQPHGTDVRVPVAELPRINAVAP